MGQSPLIVDTSALVAISRDEEGRQGIIGALLKEDGLIPSVVLHEYRRVMALPGNLPDPNVEVLLSELQSGGIAVEPFTSEDASHAADANPVYGTGNGQGGRLNFVDLMVYGMAKRTGRPVLCTGKDFQTTDIPIHPASRGW